ncbi:Kinesin-like protein KIF13A [Oopsacas minuta]|uniref:Kinesin-like protein KIF13A n=1 Tax=Oopsacas minuta TaxID=111878 RepID=A0AAV7JZ50_9METZ|nr:Kinesin-like protein KIF13A [Oopsacas minuta]
MKQRPPYQSDPNLLDENRLKEMLESGGGGAARARDTHTEDDNLAEKLKDAQNMLAQREQSWKEKIDDTRRILGEERQRIMDVLGISIQSAEIQGRSVNDMKEEKEEALRKIHKEYEEQLQEYRDKLTDAMSTPETYNPPSELDSQSLIRLQEVVLYASDLVRTANQYSEALQKEVKFSVTLRIDPSYLAPRSRFLFREDLTYCVAIRVIFTSKSTDAVWSLDTLQEKLAVIAEMYEEIERNREEKGEGVKMWWNESMGPDPFCDMENHSLIGVANAYLSCLFHFIPVEFSAPILSPQGLVIGKLNLVLQRLNTLHHDIDNFEDCDPFSTASSYTGSSISALQDILPGSNIYIRVTIQNAQDLPPNIQFVFCQYRMFGFEEAVTVASILEAGHQNSITEGCIPFNHTKTFSLEATDDFIDYCREGVLSIEVFGHRATAVDYRDLSSTTSIDENPERKWVRIRNFISLSAKILELNVEGEHFPVELKESSQSLCGGTYQLKQGQSRKIQVSVQDVQSSGLIELGSIQNIEIGSIVVRSKQDIPLDSFQEQDFNIMKEKRGQTLMLRKDYLDSEMKDLMDKQEKTSDDIHKETKLIDEWLQTQQERNLLVHSDFSQILGMSKNWYLPIGYESRPPIIFIDIENELIHKTGYIPGERDPQMLPLKFKVESSSKLDATATWDATDHENKHLMSITSPKERVFITLRVTVAMKHPPGCKIRLRKRLQIRIIKGTRGGFLAGFPFAREQVRKSGVVFEIFCGLPRTEGVPTRVDVHPSILEPNKGESIVQAFRRGMEEISNQLQLDRLRQEISLKEQLNKAGSGQLNPPPSVSPGLHSGISSSPRSQDDSESPELENIPGIVVSPPIHRPLKQSPLIPHSSSNSDLFTPPMSRSPVDEVTQQVTNLQTADITPTPNEQEPIPKLLVVSATIDETDEGLVIAKQSSDANDPRRQFDLDLAIDLKNLPRESPEALLTPDLSDNESQDRFTNPDTHQSYDMGNSQFKSPSVSPLKSPIKSPIHKKSSAPATTPSKKSSLGRAIPPRSVTPDLIDKSRININNRHSTPGAASPGVDFKLNDTVLVDLKAGNKVGKVRYIGTFLPAKDNEIWVGLQLHEPIGKHNGTVESKVYFKCKEKHGAFVPLSKIICVCNDRTMTSSNAGPRITRSFKPLDNTSRGRIKN